MPEKARLATGCGSAQSDRTFVPGSASSNVLRKGGKSQGKAVLGGHAPGRTPVKCANYIPLPLGGSSPFSGSKRPCSHGVDPLLMLPLLLMARQHTCRRRYRALNVSYVVPLCTRYSHLDLDGPRVLFTWEFDLAPILTLPVADSSTSDWTALFPPGYSPPLLPSPLLPSGPCSDGPVLSCPWTSCET